MRLAVARCGRRDRRAAGIRGQRDRRLTRGRNCRERAESCWSRACGAGSCAGALLGLGIASAVSFQAASSPNASHAPRADESLGGGDPLPVPSAPEGPTNFGLGGASSGPSPVFVFLLVVASIALVLTRPGLGGRVALRLNAPRSAALILDLERPD